MIVLGAYTHKRSHTIAAVCATSGELLGDQTVQSGAKGAAGLLGWAHGLGDARVWAIEDCRHVSGSLERFLIERGERVLRVHSTLMSAARRQARGPPSHGRHCARVWTRCPPRTPPTSRDQQHAELRLPGSALFYGSWGPRVARRLARGLRDAALAAQHRQHHPLLLLHAEHRGTRHGLLLRLGKARSKQTHLPKTMARETKGAARPLLTPTDAGVPRRMDTSSQRVAAAFHRE
jgi:hypothetical protein